MQINSAIDASEYADVAALYWQGFGGKLDLVLGPEHKARAYISAALNPEHLICARDQKGQITGIAGFQTGHGSLLKGNFGHLVAIYGGFGAAWRALTFMLLNPPLSGGSFVIDGIVVAQEHRGKGVGTALIEALAREANRKGYDRMQLEVIDDNIRARMLYERRGFMKVGGMSFGILRHVFGFRHTITMQRKLR